MTLEIASAISRNASEALLLMCILGLVMAALRWRHATRRDFLVSFGAGLLGMGLGQVPVWLGGMTGWGPDLVLFSGLARWTQFAAAVLFVRAALRDYCGPWGWRTVTLAVLLVALAI